MLYFFPIAHDRLPGAMHGGPKMAVLFTCTVCNTRSARQFSKQSYEEGVVLIRCPGCDNLHLFAVRVGSLSNMREAVVQPLFSRQSTCFSCLSLTLRGMVCAQDRLGWFDDESVDIETIMREKGEEVGWVTSAEGVEFVNSSGDGEQPPSPEP